ncbi:MAG: Uma2 family endonuclease [Labilithrix sp.]|nr:Uma2 family endonuclease [Labilithrix sp.]MBX3225297.1 Uma2 family endonuclease [Labilithrix sp.]
MLSRMRRARFSPDPSDPRAPPQEVWDALSEDERQRVVDALPSEFDLPNAGPPEGDPHRKQKSKALESLDEYFHRIRRRIYLSSELPVYYPNEPVFAPDLIAVRDVETHERMSWVVSREKRGIDLALEIHLAGDAAKDSTRNVERCARLGIPEYFAFDMKRRRLTGWRLPAEDARRYEPIVPQAGRWWSSILELDLAVEEDRLRFYHGSAPLLDARELVTRLSTMVDEAIRRAEDEARRAEDEARRAEDEARRADRLAAKLRRLGVDPDAPDE